MNTTTPAAITEELTDLTPMLRRLDVETPESVMPKGRNFH